MKQMFTMRLVLTLILGMAASMAIAGGRYADPPRNLVEVSKLTTQALEALNQGNKDNALTAAKEARKLAVESYKDKSTMPMQNGSSRLKAAVTALEGGNLEAAKTPLEETHKLMLDEIEYYKKEGKL